MNIISIAFKFEICGYGIHEQGDAGKLKGYPMSGRILLSPSGGKFDLLGHVYAVIFFDQMNIRIC